MRLATYAATVVALVLAVAPAARAHDVTPALQGPSPPPVEDERFRVAVSADVSGFAAGTGYISARVRQAGGPPCAATPYADPGTPIADKLPIQAASPVEAQYVPRVPGDYLVCAWVEDGAGAFGPPAAQIVRVRAPVFQGAIIAPAVVRRGESFSLGVRYRIEVPRYVRGVLIRTPNCSTSHAQMRRIATSRSAFHQRSLEEGNVEEHHGMAINGTGTYRFCAYFEESGELAGPPFVLDLGTIEVSPAGAPRPTTCASVRARRPIDIVEALYVPCSVAERIARRVGNARGATPRRVGRFRCSAVAPRRVTCRSRGLLVRIEFVPRRRAPRADSPGETGIGGGDG